jgi:TPR repeat protein
MAKKNAAEAVRGRAEAGSHIDQFILAARYERGEGLPRDEREAIRWYKEAARSGAPEHLMALGWHCVGQRLTCVISAPDSTMCAKRRSRIMRQHNIS